MLKIFTYTSKRTPYFLFSSKLGGRNSVAVNSRTTIQQEITPVMKSVPLNEVQPAGQRFNAISIIYWFLSTNKAYMSDEG